MIIKRGSVRPMLFDGLQISDYTSTGGTSSSLATIDVTPGRRHKEAWSRRCDKYYFVLTGTLRFMVNGEVSEVEEGDCCIVSRGQHFWYQNDTQGLARLLLFHTPPFDLDAEVFVEP